MNDQDRCLEDTFDEQRVRRAAGRLVDDVHAAEMAATFKALADPTRLRIISALAETELCVGDLAACLGMSASAVSHQLRRLRELGLVRNRRAGKHVFYTLADEHVHDLYRRAWEHADHGPAQESEPQRRQEREEDG